MDSNKGCQRFISYSIASAVISIVSMYLLLNGLPSSSYSLNFIVLAMGFVPMAFALGLILLFLIDLGIRLLAEGLSDADKVYGFLLIGFSLALPFIWASWEGIWRYNYLPFPWWLIPLAASIMTLLWSSIAFALTNADRHEAQAEKAKPKNSL